MSYPNYLKCISAVSTDKCFTEGKFYPVECEEIGYAGEELLYFVIDDEGDEHEINLDLHSSTYGQPVSSSARLVQEEPAISDEYEEEEWARLEGTSLGGHVHLEPPTVNETCPLLEIMEKNTRVCTSPSVESAVCDVAFAYQLSRIQSYIKECGADVELVVSKNYLAIVDEHCKEYRGNVEQVLEFIKADGNMKKISGEMDRRN